MKNRIFKLFGVAVIAAIGIIALCLTACPEGGGGDDGDDGDEPTKPTVVSVTPSGEGAALSGNIVITFSKTMDDTTPGLVQLIVSPALSGSTWSANKTVLTTPYSGLTAGSYMIFISGFKDAAGNTMDDSTHYFIAGTPPAVVLPAKAGLYKDSDSELLVEFDKTDATTTFNAAINYLNNGGLDHTPCFWTAT